LGQGGVADAGGRGLRLRPTGIAIPLPAPPSTCVGDCDGSGAVTVDEILTMVKIAPGNAPLLDCESADANHDGQVTVDEILAAVSNALNGCVRRP
jgi:hypothetical protein